MRVQYVQRPVSLLMVSVVLAAGGVLAGCKKDAEYSNKELAQFKQGPPKEMPPQAKQLLEQAAKAGAGGPPRQAGPPPGNTQ